MTLFDLCNYAVWFYFGYGISRASANAKEQRIKDHLINQLDVLKAMAKLVVEHQQRLEQQKKFDV